MIPTDFEGSNCVMHPPDGVSADDCETINTLITQLEDGTPVIVSCWKLTQEELDEIIRTKRIWLLVWGNGMPPVHLTGVKPIE